MREAGRLDELAEVRARKVPVRAWNTLEYDAVRQSARLDRRLDVVVGEGAGETGQRERGPRRWASALDASAVPPQQV